MILIFIVDKNTLKRRIFANVMSKIKNSLNLLFFVFVVSACHDSIPPASSFYYWKTVFQLRPYEREILEKHHVNRLYIRYFDVVQRQGKDQPDPDILPDATIFFKDSIPANIEVVPVVFVVNNVLTGLPADSMEMLAKRILDRIGSINRRHHIPNVREIQMDCDWNASTRDKYFSLLRVMHDRLHGDGMQLSATLRLHQLKYRKTTGIPPADRVTLMCYNMGHLTEYGSRNSILDVDEAQNYLQGLGLYPLPVDVALPLFSWGVCFSNKHYRGLINGLCEADMQQPYFAEIAPGMYRADSAVILRGAYIRKGDHIRLEEPSAGDIRKVARMAASQIKTTQYVTWYHLDSLLLQKHPDHELQEIIHLFR